MKNRKTLHEEISRVRVLMEVQLLTESKYKGVADVLLSLGDEMAELVAKHSDEFLRLRNAVTDKEAVEVLSELVNLEKRFADEIIPRIFGVLDDNYQAEINAATNRLIDFKKNNLLINDETIGDQLGALKGLFNQWPGIDKIIKKQIKDVLDGVPRNPITIPSKNLEDSRLVKDLQDTFKKWDEIAPGVLSIADKKLMGLGPFRGLRAKLKYTITNLLNTIPPLQKKSMERIVGYLKEAADKMINDAETPTELFRLIDTEIESLRKNEDFTKNEIYNLIQREVNKATGTDKGFSIVSALKENDALGKNAESYFKSLLDDNAMVDEISQTFQWVPGGIMKKENVVNFTTGITKLLQRVFGMVTAGYATNLSSIYRSFLLKHGVLKGTWYLYLYFQGVAKIVWPSIYGMYEYLKNSLVTQETQFEETEESLSFFIQEEFKKAMGIYNVEFIKLFGKEIPTFELDIIKAINPFTNVWAKLIEASDYWITQGGLREWTLQSVENAGGNAEEAGRQLDSLYQVQQARFDSLVNAATQQRLDSIRNLPVVDTTSLRGVNTTPRTTVPQTSTTTVPQTSGRNRDN
jgi:hypothetical protein